MILNVIYFGIVSSLSVLNSFDFHGGMVVSITHTLWALSFMANLFKQVEACGIVERDSRT